MARRLRFSAIFYNALYFFLYVILLGLLLITPADAIERSRRNKQTYNIWILIAAYVLVTVVVGFVYFTRLYINKTDLASIPKAWVPIDKGDVRSAVYKMIAAGLNRSAEIAFDARPRLLHTPGGELDENTEHIAPKMSASLDDQNRSPLSPTAPARRPVWGEIEHYGWASPNVPDLPNLQYSTVISELPYLIEAKAVTLAPPDPTSQNINPPLLDADSVALLQRAPNMDLREYINHLASIGVLSVDATVTNFLSQYEYARYSTRPISNERFKNLMRHFAELLRAMRPLEPYEAADALSFVGSVNSNDYVAENVSPTAPQTRYFATSGSDSSSTHSSVRRHHRNSSASTWYVYRTAPQSLRSRMTGPSNIGLPVSRQSSHSLSRSPSNKLSNASLRRVKTSSSTSSSGNSSGSVIRLATRQDSTELPYVLSLRETFNG